MRNWFVNPEEDRLRAGWRLLVMAAVLVALNLALQTGFKALNGGIPDASRYVNTAMLIIMMAIAMTLSVIFARRYLDRRSLASLGLFVSKRTVPTIIAGFLISGAMAALFVGLAYLFGAVEFTGIAWGNGAPDFSSWPAFSASIDAMNWGTLGLFFFITVVVSWWEELYFRGYFLRNLAEGTSFLIAAIVSGVIFGFIHITNPNATVLSALIIVIFSFKALYGVMVTNAIWMSFGMHVGWNFFQGVVLDYNASGNDMTSIIGVNPVGPDWLSGGDFGPENSVLILPVLAVAFVLIKLAAKALGEDRGHDIGQAEPVVVRDGSIQQPD
ncbi:CPBP family intramembrane metalloprotease [Qipengyuania sp. 1XM1-15A]|uniref:CPBP family intramembrane glutamic endopeptidase n=1 Tax=Qipengyuania xiamenensis TaxID=2867237 RepID=UPI001C8680AA|nr:CPBP family intramembrane glutamic endopeptidase [Qipengyuania xiamenensis]MBX7533431.1 CPBP family intramembrane metalloprotease [Qipengyuania xiamenensis]